MGLEGKSYRDILAFYFPGAVVGATARGLNWQRLGGDNMVLFTTQPDRDGSLLDLAERQSRSVVQRTGWPMPANIEIRVYPDLDAYRNATGEPGWIAAYTQGSRIHLQPVSVLRSHNALESTLRHELFHVAVESRAARGLPIWFREGLVEYLDGEPASNPPPDSVRRSHADALRAVRNLIQRYGETTVLGWVARGLPPDVKNSRVIHDPTNSK